MNQNKGKKKKSWHSAEGKSIDGPFEDLKNFYFFSDDTITL
jgi:hypothetical protein